MFPRAQGERVRGTERCVFTSVFRGREIVASILRIIYFAQNKIFTNAIKRIRLAPSNINRQAFRIFCTRVLNLTCCCLD